jgi:hypothetical protein
MKKAKQWSIRHSVILGSASDGYLLFLFPPNFLRAFATWRLGAPYSLRRDFASRSAVSGKKNFARPQKFEPGGGVL